MGRQSSDPLSLVRTAFLTALLDPTHWNTSLSFLSVSEEHQDTMSSVTEDCGAWLIGSTVQFIYLLWKPCSEAWRWGDSRVFILNWIFYCAPWVAIYLTAVHLCLGLKLSFSSSVWVLFAPVWVHPLIKTYLWQSSICWCNTSTSNTRKWIAAYRWCE